MEMGIGMVFIINSYMPKGSCLKMWKAACGMDGCNASDTVVKLDPDFRIFERHIRSDYDRLALQRNQSNVHFCKTLTYRNTQQILLASAVSRFPFPLDAAIIP